MSLLVHVMSADDNNIDDEPSFHAAASCSSSRPAGGNASFTSSMHKKQLERQTTNESIKSTVSSTNNGGQSNSAIIRGFFPYTTNAAIIDSPTASATDRSSSSSSGREESMSSSSYSPSSPNGSCGMSQVSFSRESSVSSTDTRPSATNIGYNGSIGSVSSGDSSNGKGGYCYHHQRNDSTATPSSDRSGATSSNNSSSNASSEVMIDHTALLLSCLSGGNGDDDEDSEMDDEREWNATFSLDELEQQHHQQQHQQEKDNFEKSDNGEDTNTNFDLISVALEDAIPVASLARQRTTQNKIKPQRPLALSRGTTTMDTTNHLTTTTTTTRPSSMLRSKTIDMNQPLSRPSLPPNRMTSMESWTSTDYKLVQKQFPIGSDVWRKEEEDRKIYYKTHHNKKKYDSFEYKKKMAAMKAAALKERVSSSLTSKAIRAKETVKTKISKKNNSSRLPSRTGGSNVDGILSHEQESWQHPQRRQPRGMIISTSTTDHDHNDDDASQVSEVSDHSTKNNYAAYRAVTKTIKSKLLSSQARINKETSHMKSSMASSKVSQIATTKLHSSKLAVLDIINTADQQGSCAIIKARQLFTTSSKGENNSLLLDGGDNSSTIPNSQSRNSLQQLDGDKYSKMVGMSGRLVHTIITPSHRDNYHTPRVTLLKKCSTTTRGSNDTDLTPPKSNLTSPKVNCTKQGGSLLSPPPHPPISTCLSNSSHAGTVSCIDASGFLISSNISIDRVGSDGDGGGGGAVSSSITVSSESAFDPNSFLFLSPLSNHDFDDVDYGMPELLRLSTTSGVKNMSNNSRNTDVYVPSKKTGSHPPVGPPPAESTMGWKALISPTIANSKRLARIPPPSPRLLPLSSPRTGKSPWGNKSTRKTNKSER